MPRIALTGSLSFTTAVFASGKVIDRIGALGFSAFTSSRPLPTDVDEILSQLYFRSWVVITRLLVGGRGSHLLFGRSLKVSVSLSGDTSHEPAASPSTEPSAGASGVPCL